MSADSLGVIAVWDVFPFSRRLCKVQGHSDSVQASPKMMIVFPLARHVLEAVLFTTWKECKRRKRFNRCFLHLPRRGLNGCEGSAGS